VTRFKRRARERILPYLQRLYGYAQSLTRNPENAEDLVQQAALKALAARGAPEDEAAYRAWLFRIVKNQFIDNYRRDQRRQRDEVAFETVYDVPMDYWRGDERIINKVSVRTAMARLNDHHTEILALIDFAGLSYREAADVLDVPVGTVMSRINRARAALLAVLEEPAGEVLELSRRRNRRG